MGSEPPVRLLELEPDLIRYLSTEHRAEARAMLFPVERVKPGDFDASALFDDTHSFGVLLLDGMVVQRLRLAGHAGVRLIGPGEFIGLTQQARSDLISESVCRAVLPTRFALLGYELLAATHRWPMLVAGLQTRQAEQSERVVAQLMICQLPRVEERVMGIMWLLAETWGHVTGRGTLLPLALTHELLGLLVGARRPTVSLALRELTERGALLKQDVGWLLLERPASSARTVRLDDPQVLTHSAADWSTGTAATLPVPRPVHVDYEALKARFERQREEHLARVTLVRTRLAEMREARERNRERRLHLMSLRSPRAPSS